MGKKILKWIGNIIIAILLIMVIISGYSMLTTRNNPSKVPSIIGFKPLAVLSGSMRPVLQPGDMVVVKNTNYEDIEIGDVITYRVNSNTLVTHRVIEIVEDNKKILFKTQGDANNVEDSKLVSTEQLIGVMAFNIPKGGYVANFIRSPKGFILLILVPLIFLVGGEFKTILSKMDEEDKKDSNSEDNVEI